MAVTFVTCCITVYDVAPTGRSLEWRMSNFRHIAETGVKIVVYGCDDTMPYLTSVAESFENVRVLRIDHEGTPVHRACSDPGLRMPGARDEVKDTAAYMALINTKIEFIYDAVVRNVWGTDVFAWIDFNIAYVFRDLRGTLSKIKRISERPYPPDFLYIAGIWGEGGDVLDRVNWRYCGGFFIGDGASLRHFYALYREHLPAFLREHRVLVWEVNFWAWMETNAPDWKATWYRSNHDDSIVDIPA